MKTRLTITIATLAARTFANPGMGQTQSIERAKLIEDAKKGRQGDGLGIVQRVGRQSARGGLRKKYPFVNMEFYSSMSQQLIFQT